MSALYPSVLDEEDWYFVHQVGKPMPPLMVISEDVGGLTLVARWVRTDALVRINDDDEDEDA